MSIFSKFKNHSKIDKKDQSEKNIEQLPFEITYNSTPDGNLQIEFCDIKSDFKKFYDTTRLIIRRDPLNIAGHKIYNCAVSWYGSSDCRYVDESTGAFESPRARTYHGVLAEINLDLLQHDQNYCKAVMQDLLDKNRVERYLENGLQENPKQPCGKYVGGIMQTENGYGKFFSVSVGKASHSSKLMVDRRNRHREMAESIKQQAILDKKAQIQKLQNEIDNMEK